MMQSKGLNRNIFIYSIPPWEHQATFINHITNLIFFYLVPYFATEITIREVLGFVFAVWRMSDKLHPAGFFRTAV